LLDLGEGMDGSAVHLYIEHVIEISRQYALSGEDTDTNTNTHTDTNIPKTPTCSHAHAHAYTQTPTRFLSVFLSSVSLSFWHSVSCATSVIRPRVVSLSVALSLPHTHSRTNTHNE